MIVPSILSSCDDPDDDDRMVAVLPVAVLPLPTCVVYTCGARVCHSYCRGRPLSFWMFGNL